MKPARQTRPTSRVRSSCASRAIEVVARRERAVIEDQRLDAGARARGRARRRPARFEMTTAMRAVELAARDRVDQRLKIAAAAGDQHADRRRLVARATAALTGS